MWESMHHSWSGMGFNMLLWLLIIIGVFVVVVYAVIRRPNSEGDRPDHALQILRERYARGEIDEQEFEVRKRELEK